MTDSPSPVTDGGAVTDDDACRTDEQCHLGSIFRSIAGDEPIVARQDPGPPRYVEADDEPVSEYVASMTRVDGLEDAIDEPDVG